MANENDESFETMMTKINSSGRPPRRTSSQLVNKKTNAANDYNNNNKGGAGSQFLSHEVNYYDDESRRESSSNNSIIIPRPPSVGRPSNDMTIKRSRRSSSRYRIVSSTNNNENYSNLDTNTNNYRESSITRAGASASSAAFVDENSFNDNSSSFKRMESTRPKVSIRDQSDIINLLQKTNLSGRPLSTRLTKYTEPLPEIGKRFSISRKSQSSNHNHSNDLKKQSVSSSSTYTNEDEDLDDDENESASKNNSHRMILLGIRLPNGKKLQQQFSAQSKLIDVVDYGLKSSEADADMNVHSYALIQMPNLVIEDLNCTIESYNIPDRSMLFIIHKNFL